LTGTEEAPEQLYSNWRTFVSIEPLLAMPDLGFLKRDNLAWVIIGAQTGPGAKQQHRPKREWIQSIVDECRKEGVPLFMKDSLLEIWEGAADQRVPGGAAAEGSHHPPLRASASMHQGDPAREPRHEIRLRPNRQTHTWAILKDKPALVPKKRGGIENAL
jgi:hypothetical protein